MYAKRVIKDIETYFSRYCESSSNQMLYYSTKHLLDFLCSFDMVRTILSDLKKKYPYDLKTLKRHQETGGPIIIKEVGLNRTQYVSYVLHFLEYSYSQTGIIKFYDEVPWICYSDKDYNIKERIQLFKTEVVKPLCDYIIDELRKYVSLIDVIERYKNRTMRFESPYPEYFHERKVQDKLALYLYDRGYLVHREEDLTNGKPDFLFSDDEGTPFVIEVKYVKEKVCPSSFNSYTSQLRDYVNKLESHVGVLCIFTTSDHEYLWENAPDNMKLITIYVGGKKPSERNTQNICIDFKSSCLQK